MVKKLRSCFDHMWCKFCDCQGSAMKVSPIRSLGPIHMTPEPAHSEFLQEYPVALRAKGCDACKWRGCSACDRPELGSVAKEDEEARVSLKRKRETSMVAQERLSTATKNARTKKPSSPRAKEPQPAMEHNTTAEAPSGSSMGGGTAAGTERISVLQAALAHKQNKAEQKSNGSPKPPSIDKSTIQGERREFRPVWLLT